MSEEVDTDVSEGLKIWKKMQDLKVCPRCKKKMTAKGLSLLNDDIICEECKEKEKKLPEYSITAKNIVDEAKSLLKKMRKRT